MALKRWVIIVAPFSTAEEASSNVASVWPIEYTIPREVISEMAETPICSGAAVIKAENFKLVSPLVCP